MQYDTRLKFEGISSDLQSRLGIRPAEEVVFARLEHGAYRDGIRFSNGKEVSLQLLGAGVSVTIAAKETAPAAAARKPQVEAVD